jgi:hypothetical protein
MYQDYYQSRENFLLNNISADRFISIIDNMNCEVSHIEESEKLFNNELLDIIEEQLKPYKCYLFYDYPYAHRTINILEDVFQSIVLIHQLKSASTYSDLLQNIFYHISERMNACVLITANLDLCKKAIQNRIQSILYVDNAHLIRDLKLRKLVD